jgi:hypothetical protein
MAPNRQTLIKPNVAYGSMDSDVPCQAPNARLIALLLPFWLEGSGRWIVQGWRRDLKTSVIKL